MFRLILAHAAVLVCSVGTAACPTCKVHASYSYAPAYSQQSYSYAQPAQAFYYQERSANPNPAQAQMYAPQSNWQVSGKTDSDGYFGFTLPTSSAPRACAAVGAMPAELQSYSSTAPGACKPIAGMGDPCPPPDTLGAAIIPPAPIGVSYDSVEVGAAEEASMPAALRKSFAEWRASHLRSRADRIERRVK